MSRYCFVLLIFSQLLVDRVLQCQNQFICAFTVHFFQLSLENTQSWHDHGTSQKYVTPNSGQQSQKASKYLSSLYYGHRQSVEVVYSEHGFQKSVLMYLMMYLKNKILYHYGKLKYKLRKKVLKYFQIQMYLIMICVMHSFPGWVQVTACLQHYLLGSVYLQQNLFGLVQLTRGPTVCIEQHLLGWIQMTAVATMCFHHL